MLIGKFVITQRGALYKSVFGLKRLCTRCLVFLVVRRVVHIWQRDLSSGLQGVDFGCTKSKVKGKSQGVAWGLDVGHEDRTRINLSCLRLLNFSEILFFFMCKYVYFFILIFL